MKNDESAPDEKKIAETQAAPPPRTKKKVDNAAIPAGYTIYEWSDGVFEILNGSAPVAPTYSTLSLAITAALSHKDLAEKKDSSAVQTEAKENPPDTGQAKAESKDQQNSPKDTSPKKPSLPRRRH
ncbi:MAG: hypothetical protein M3O74_10395 [Pseudomonadota bacterium]|nr:hypothetical protein [Pseudomonadota bacterium]